MSRPQLIAMKPNTFFQTTQHVISMNCLVQVNFSNPPYLQRFPLPSYQSKSEYWLSYTRYLQWDEISSNFRSQELISCQVGTDLMWAYLIFIRHLQLEGAVFLSGCNSVSLSGFRVSPSRSRGTLSRLVWGFLQLSEMSPCKLQLKLVLSKISSSHPDSSQEIVACLAGLVDFGQATAQFQGSVARNGSISIKKPATGENSGRPCISGPHVTSSTSN